MECTTNTSKWEQWTARFSRYERSETTVREFCHDEGVSVPSFYQWRHKVRGGSVNTRLFATSRRPARETRTTPSSFKPILVTSVPSAAVMTIRLPQGIIVEIGQDHATIEQVMQQLLTHSTTLGAESC